MFTLTFYGGAQTVTGSKYLVTTENGKRVLLDCGMFQGKGVQSVQYNREFGFDAKTIDYLILSHAHIDHTGLVPKLVKEGFAGAIFCTPPTIELASLILHDSAHIQSSTLQDGEVPLYSEEDVKIACKLMQAVPYDQPYEIDENLIVQFTDAGHIVGSAVVNLTIHTKHRQKQLCFTGDIGRFNNRLLKTPQPFPTADYIICESTYGDKLHSVLEHSEEKLRQIVYETCVEKKGKLLIPAFSIGRTQELVYSLNLLAEDGRLPRIPVFVDSPLAVYATDIVRDHMQYFNEDMLQYINQVDDDPFGFKNLKYITEADESKMLVKMDEPCVIISSSGMMEGGRIQHHVKAGIEDPRNTILITGYCEPSTLGGQLSNGATSVYIHGQQHTVGAQIEFMKEYSAHGDYGDLLKFLHCQDKESLKCLFLVHGEKHVMETFKNTLHNEGYSQIEIPGYRMSYDL